ncbi:MAG: hypothetical protein ACRCX2_22890 [Paraclostridium sp.]
MFLPGTHIKERLSRGDRPINDLDEVSMNHDIDYMNSLEEYKRDRDHSKFMKNIHTADKKFIPKAYSSKDEPILGKIASGLMTTKMLGEKAHIIPSTLFSGASSNKNPAHRLYKMALRSKSPQRVKSPPRVKSSYCECKTKSGGRSRSPIRRSRSPIKRKRSPLKRDRRGRFLPRGQSRSRSRSQSRSRSSDASYIEAVKEVLDEPSSFGSGRMQKGGLGPLASILIPLVMSAASPLVEKLIKKVTGGGGKKLGGTLQKMRINQKRKYLLSQLLE